MLELRCVDLRFWCVHRLGTYRAITLVAVRLVAVRPVYAVYSNVVLTVPIYYGLYDGLLLVLPIGDLIYQRYHHILILLIYIYEVSTKL